MQPLAQRPFAGIPPLVAALCLLGPGLAGAADDATELRKEVQELRKQNALLQEQLHKQQETLDNVQRKITVLESNRTASATAPAPAPATEEPAAADGLFSGPLKIGSVHLSGEGGLALFRQGPKGAFSHGEFRVDEAKLFVDAPIWKDTYFFTELNLMQREDRFNNFSFGELYLDFEDVSQLWGKERQLNIRAGRMDIPFGEEYLTRDAIDNPLISHSVADFWGVDEGVELYGAFGQISYVVAVQNGGSPAWRDYNGDKSVAARISYDPKKWLHLSASAMRTGELDVAHDHTSELWFGGGQFEELGGAATTTRFHANLAQGDVEFRWTGGHVHLAGGYATFDDNDSTADNRRHFWFSSVEGMQKFSDHWYGATRFSQILAPKGYDLMGEGPYTPGLMTTELWRWSLGLGYRFSRNLVVKGEYTWNYGVTLGGGSRNGEDLFALEAAFGF